MPRVLAVGEEVGPLVIPARLRPMLPEFQARVHELYPQVVQEPYLTMMRRVELQPEEQVALVESPDGPRIFWHWLVRAVHGLEP